ncbi:MAG TPA: DMT family transporter, partial [Anaerolineales bacterium]|nr:DMT family transporter [Anaerolineales bacterium]
VILLGKFASRFDALTFSVGQLIICGLLNLGLGAFVEHSVSIEAMPLIVAVIFTALFSIALGYTLQVWAQRHTPPADAALILSLESVFAALAGWLFLRETMTLIQVFGCTLIFAAVLFSQVKPRVSE